MWKLNRSLFGDIEVQEDGILEESDEICSLSATQRVYSFAACFVAGIAFLFLSLVAFTKPLKFAVLFSLGNLLAVGSSALLIGPGQQIRMMFDPVRIYATAIYLGFVVLALIFALLIHDIILTVVAMICEICALIWYSLSYIPFARRLVSNLAVRFCDTEI